MSQSGSGSSSRSRSQTVQKLDWDYARNQECRDSCVSALVLTFIINSLEKRFDFNRNESRECEEFIKTCLHTGSEITLSNFIWKFNKRMKLSQGHKILDSSGKQKGKCVQFYLQCNAVTENLNEARSMMQENYKHNMCTLIEVNHQKKRGADRDITHMMAAYHALTPNYITAYDSDMKTCQFINVGKSFWRLYVMELRVEFGRTEFASNFFIIDFLENPGWW